MEITSRGDLPTSKAPFPESSTFQFIDKKEKEKRKKKKEKRKKREKKNN